MARIYRMVFEVCWGLGVLSLLAAIVLRLAPTLALRLATSPRGGLLLAGVLFLCALTTREMSKASSSTS